MPQGTMISFRLDEDALAKLDAAVAQVKGSSRSALAEAWVRDRLNDGDEHAAAENARVKGARRAIVDFKKMAGHALGEVLKEWQDK